MEIKLESINYELNKKIIDNVNLNIKPNSIIAIMGKSGSGKTTLAEILDLLIFPTSGYLKFDDELIDNDCTKQIRKLKYKVGLVFQFPEEQFFCNTVEKEIEFGLNYLNKDISQIKKRVNDALKMVGLNEDYLKRSLFNLSGGEKRKVAIASILAFNPEVIILDEPTIGLDATSKKSLIKILKMLKNRYNKTIIIVSKDSDLVHSICDSVVIIDNGKIVLSGSKYEVFTQNIEEFGLKKPKIIEFEQLALKNKNVRLLYRDDINDLMKDVYRNVK